MAWTIDSALDTDMIEVISREEANGIYRIRLGELRTVVTIRLKPMQRGRYTQFLQSHVIQTPCQATPYRTSRPFNDTPAAALHQAIGGLVSYYDEAVRAGHKPCEEWLVLY